MTNLESFLKRTYERLYPFPGVCSIYDEDFKKLIQIIRVQQEALKKFAYDECHCLSKYPNEICEFCAPIEEVERIASDEP